MKIEEVIKKITIPEKNRNSLHIPDESLQLLRAMGIPEDEWEFIVGIDRALPARYLRMKEQLSKLGLELKEEQEENSSLLLIKFPENLKLQEALYLSSLSQCSNSSNYKITINFSKNSSGTIVIGSPVPKIFATNIVQNEIEINLADDAKGEIAFLHSYDMETYTNSIVNTNIGNNAFLKLAGVTFNPGKQFGIQWKFNLMKGSQLYFDEVNFLMDHHSYRGSWSELNINGPNVNCVINSADFDLAEGETKAVYIAKIKEGSKGANVEINSYSMDFSDGAKKMFLPGFYTEEDEVVLRHSAGNAEFNKEKIEYMRGRGLSVKEISYLVIDTILEKTVYEKLPPNFLREISNYTKFIINKASVII